MKGGAPFSAYAAFWISSAVFLAGFATLGVRLHEEQIINAAAHARRMASQSHRTAQTSGLRGRILDRRGEPLADNRLSLCVAVDAAAFRGPGDVEERLAAAAAAVARAVGRPPDVPKAAVRRHLRLELPRLLILWRGLSEDELARFEENSFRFPGFECVTEAERIYPQGATAAHLAGRVGRDRKPVQSGDSRPDYIDREPCGREGLELQYDEYLRGVPGEERLLVDARGFSAGRETVAPARPGPDLVLTVDLALQRAAEAQLAGLCGACAAIDPRNGAVRVLASAPSYNPGECVPVLSEATYRRLSEDPGKPLLARAVAGTYAPGSTFKLVTALAGLSAGHAASETRFCDGAWELGGMKIKCARIWGHGELDLPHALRESCNPYFCGLGVAVGIGELARTARILGLGSRTGIDFPADAAGLVPDAAWKESRRGAPWRTGDLAQMSIGQGMLLATPLQMARLAAAVGSGRIATPRLNAALPPDVRPLPFSAGQLEAVRLGMRLVVDGGTGRRGGEGVEARVIGKTGTAQVGSGATRRKNAWFVAYATPTAASRTQEPLAVALIVEDGESGGTTAAPRVAEILKAFYNRGHAAAQPQSPAPAPAQAGGGVA